MSARPDAIKPQTLFNHFKTTYPPAAFKDDPLSLYNAIEAYINEHGFMMTFRATKLARAQEVLSKMTPKPKVLLEFGTFVGSSAVGWGAILKDLHKDDPDALKQSRVYTFELDPEIANIARFFISLAGLEDIVTVLDGKPASECLRELYNQGKVVKGGVDAAFFDHAKEHYVPDLKLVGDELGLFRVGSVAIADNTDFPGAPEYVEFMRRGGDRVKFDSKTYLGDEPGTKAKAVEISTVVKA